MKKLWIICLALVLVLTSCGTAAVTETAADKQPELSAQETDQTSAEQPTEEPTEKPTEAPAEKPTEAPTEKPAATTAVPAVSTGPTLEFTGDVSDMYLLINTPGWAYETAATEKDVVFFEAASKGTPGEKSFTIFSIGSGNISPDQLWESMAGSMESSLTNFTWEKSKKPLDVGGYDGTYFLFTSDEKYGDTVIWETDTRFYICSMLAIPEDYEEMDTLLKDALSTFCPASEK